ncbi:MAG: Wzz/FepE/Etk N-terminal domain-containing protein [Firmicutes bacterium]|nr:Wzz/FepE/Etk N-terminal domain-containing protein [Bacillota bacterium]
MSSEKDNNVVQIDLLRIFKAIRKKLALILAVTLLCGIGGFLVSKLVTPQYSAYITMYVSNKETSSGSISSSDISVSQSLVDTYGVILESYSCLGSVIAQESLPYTYSQLAGMISTSSVSSTEVMKVTVTGTDAEEVVRIANALADIAPTLITSVVQSSSVSVVDYALLPATKVSPSTSRYTMMGLLIGLLLSVAPVVVLEILDNKIHGEDDLKAYSYPLLATIPEFDSESGNKRGSASI